MYVIKLLIIYMQQRKLKVLSLQPDIFACL